MSVQSLMKPEITSVSALVLPMSKNTLMLSPNAAIALLRKIIGSNKTADSWASRGSSKIAHGMLKNKKDTGAM